jgi:translation initiation factor 3 subunit K
MPFLEHLHELVRSCQFTKFWQEYKGSSEAANILHSNPNYLAAHKGLVPQLRNHFAASIAASFRRIRTAQLARWLDLSAADLAAWVKSADWEIVGDVAVVPANGDNDVKAGVVKENVELKREYLDVWTLADAPQSSPSLSLPRRTRWGDVHMHVVTDDAINRID